ncbi:type IV secretory system conjugative DNA transfer family protein [Pseudovibrio ascidiaceicola]|uniref:type IV secretory system conjugative DNA transfer family protein n=1 Tax=Pseudovibrio ascidiaceicola TaxID=285279 RepID=UPI003D36E835
MRLNLSVASVLLLLLAGCQSFDSGKEHKKAPEALQGETKSKEDSGQFVLPNPPTADLTTILGRASTVQANALPAKDDKDKLRIPAMEEAALAYGAQAGLAHATDQITAKLNKQGRKLSRIYSFDDLMLPGPNGVLIRPPVIVEARDTWEAADEGKSLRISDTVYEIIEDARFASVAPTWHEYLLIDFPEPELPNPMLLPKSSQEKSQWDKWVVKGWREGEKQAQESLQTNLRRLKRDFGGMVRFNLLLEENKVSAPVLAEGNMGVTGDGNNMRVNDRSLAITADSKLIIRPAEWQSSPTSVDDAGATIGTRRHVKPVPATQPQGQKKARKKSAAPKTTPVLIYQLKPAAEGQNGRF